MRRLYLANSLLLFDFWLTLAIPYMVYRGLSLETAVALLSMYTIAATLLEYPTGVVGDYFGHRFSVIIGMGFAVVSNILLLLAISPVGFALALLMRALGMTLRSGSTEALLQSNSKSLKKDMAVFGGIEDVVMFVASVLAGIIADIDFGWALSLNIFLSGLAFVIGLGVQSKSRDEKLDGNIFYLANQGLRFVSNRKSILVSLILLTAFYAYGKNVKSIFAILGDNMDLRLSYLGLVIGLGMLARSLGRFFYGKFHEIRVGIVVMFFSALLLIAGWSNYLALVVGAIIGANFCMGIILSSLKVKVMEEAPASIRASVLSLAGLMSTLTGSLYLWGFGQITVQVSFSAALMLTVAGLAMVYGVLGFVKEVENG